jgi:hypothetical protein
MLAKAVDRLPDVPLQYEPKWDGFRCIVFRDGDDLALTSRNSRPFNRYFPELVGPLLERLPRRCVIDGEIVVPTERGLDFGALQQRIHPAASRVARLAEQQPASFVAFDLLASDDLDLRATPLADRRRALQLALDDPAPSLYLTPSTNDPAQGRRWFAEFEGAGLDGVIAKPLGGSYESDQRGWYKLKPVRTADCVVAGFRWHKNGGVGSLLLGLYDHRGDLVHEGSPVGARRRAPTPPGPGPGQPPLGSLGRCRRARGSPPPRRAEPLDRRKGPLVGTARPRARGRGPLRPAPRGPLPTRNPVREVATGPRPAVVPVRPAHRRSSPNGERALRVDARPGGSERSPSPLGWQPGPQGPKGEP